jgi:hypothetical protein
MRLTGFRFVIFYRLSKAVTSVLSFLIHERLATGHSPYATMIRPGGL